MLISGKKTMELRRIHPLSYSVPLLVAVGLVAGVLEAGALLTLAGLLAGLSLSGSV